MHLRSLFLLLLSGSVLAETDTSSNDVGGDLNPSACTYEELKGNWVFEIGPDNYDKTIDCGGTAKVVKKEIITLDYPDVAKDQYGNVGFWTMVDSLGIEVVIHGRKFFAYIKFKEAKNGKDIRYCNQTIFGTSHTVLGDNWACFYGKKSSSLSPKSSEQMTIKEIMEREGQREKRSTNELNREDLRTRAYRTDTDMVDSINAAQSSWTATHYDEYDTMTMDEMLSKAGSRLHRKNRVFAPTPMTKEQQDRIAAYPTAFDWRNVKGINYVSPVRDQGKCGSCYAFTAAAMNEARLAIFTNRTVQVVLSTQDVVDCTFYSLACDGGSAYAIAGKYAEDYGMVEESCNPYKGVENNRCGTKTSCKRYYFTGYEFIGGYFGACNEADMIAALVNYGPLAIAIKVQEDLMFYKSGIYYSTGIKSKFNPTFDVDHAVTLVGYGEDKTHGPYWIIKNSWGPTWGDKGYFRLRRRVNECGVESDAVQSFPIF